MSTPDLNLLVTLDVLLAEGSVARAAQRLRLSPSAMSRALARLRETTGDPLLVRAGRGSFRHPERSNSASGSVSSCRMAEAVLRPAEKLDLKQLVRTFTLRTSEGFVENFGPDLIARVGEEAPGVRLASCRSQTRTARRFATGPSIWRPASWGRRPVRRCVRRHCSETVSSASCAMGHALSQGEITPSRYAAGRHICVSRRGLDKGPIDEALKPLGLEREIVTIVGGFSTALALARASDLIASVPERHTGNLRAGMHSFPLPVSTPEITVSLLWHPRLDADPAHRWLRGLVRDACAAAGGPRQAWQLSSMNS